MDRACFGKSYWKLHQVIDFPFFFYGRKHREHFHDYVSVILIAKRWYPGDLVAFEAACLHVLLDNVCTYNPEMKAYLKDRAKRYYQNIKKLSEQDKYKKPIKLSPKLKKLVKDLKNQIKARRWYDRFFGL
jgi:hypothetical protein